MGIPISLVWKVMRPAPAVRTSAAGLLAPIPQRTAGTVPTKIGGLIEAVTFAKVLSAPKEGQ